MVTSEEFEKGLLGFNGENQSYHYDYDSMLPFTNGVKYLIETLNFPELIYFTNRMLSIPEFHMARYLYGCKTLLLMDVNEKGCWVSVRINDEEFANMEVKEREDLPYLHVAMILGNQAIYLIYED